MLTAARSLTGTFANLPADGWLTSSDGLAKFLVSVGPQTVTLTGYTPIPEPSVLAAMLLPTLLLRRRSRVTHC